MTARDIIGAFNVLKNWYRKFAGKALRPLRVDLECARQTHEELVANHNLSDICPYEFEYDGETVNDSIPSEQEIRNALFKMRSRKAPGLTQISVDQLKEWCDYVHGEEATKEAREIWNKIVELVQRYIEYGDIPRAFINGILVIIPKDA